MEPDHYPYVYLGNSRADGKGLPVYMMCWYIHGFGVLDGNPSIRTAFSDTGKETVFFPDNGDFDAVLERTREVLRYRTLQAQRSVEPNPENELPDGPEPVRGE